jgi:hypothetical protein
MRRLPAVILLLSAAAFPDLGRKIGRYVEGKIPNTGNLPEIKITPSVRAGHLRSSKRGPSLTQ